MKNTKQPKVSPVAHQTFILAAQSAALEAARRVAFKVEAGQPGTILSIEDVNKYAVSVFQRTETFERSSWAENKTIVDRYLVLDVLINPALLPVASRAKEAYNQVLPLIEAARAKAPGVRISHFNSLAEMAGGSHAISCVFRAWVQVGENGEALKDNTKGGTFTACSFIRRDSIGQLNAVQYGSLQGVEKLLVRKLHSGPVRKDQCEKWAGNAGRPYDEINVERIVADAVVQAQSYGSLSDEEIKSSLRHLTQEKIDEAVKDHLHDEARRVRILRLVADIEALGLTVVKGPERARQPDEEWTCFHTIAVTATPVANDNRATYYTLVSSEESLVALHKALIK
jgi:hypothetical protein